MNDDELKEMRRRDDFEWLLSDVRGRRIVRLLLDEARIYHNSFAPDNTHQTAFNEGVRQGGLRLLAHIGHCSHFHLMMNGESSNE